MEKQAEIPTVGNSTAMPLSASEPVTVPTARCKLQCQPCACCGMQTGCSLAKLSLVWAHGKADTP